jgi:hypothetical protein
VSGLRKCAECDRLFRIENDGPEPMRADGTFPRHECSRCSHLKWLMLTAREGLSTLAGAKTEFVKTGSGPEVHVIVPGNLGTEAHVLSIRFRKDMLVADVAMEDSGVILHDEVTFAVGQDFEALAPLLAVL